MDALRVYVVFDPAFDAGPALYELLTKAFDCIGMQRDGLRFSVPVHHRSVPWGAAQESLPPACPRRIDPSLAQRNLVLVLQDAVMCDRLGAWTPYVDDLRAQCDARAAAARAAGEPAPDLLVPALVDGSEPAFERLTQSVRFSSAGVRNDPRERTRLLIQLLNAVLVQRDPADQRDASGAGHPIFVSHAKRDGVDIARQIVELIAKVNHKLGPRCFFDADSLLPGDDYTQRFDASITRGSLLAVVTAAYHTRPWCRWEVLRAKQHGRPVVTADLTDGRIERTFPYLGNVPSIRIEVPAAAAARPSADAAASPGAAASSAGAAAAPSVTAAPPPDEASTLPDEAVERLTLALLSESLRVALWRDRAAPHAAPGDHLCIRPPELTDVALVAAQAGAAPARVLYPDPPLSTEELDLLRDAFPQIEVRTLSQAIA